MKKLLPIISAVSAVFFCYISDVAAQVQPAAPISAAAARVAPATASPARVGPATVTAVKTPSWQFNPNYFSEMRAGGHLATQTDHPAGGAIELTFGYHFKNGWSPVLDLATSVMFDDVGPDETLYYYRLGGGVRYTAPKKRVRPWLQATYGLIAYVNTGEEGISSSTGQGLSLTAGCNFGVTHIDNVSVWLGFAGGVDIGVFDGGDDNPFRAMLTLGFQRLGP